MRKAYDNVVVAINDLRREGFNEDFNLKTHCLECVSNGFQVLADEFEVDGVFRFDGDTNPADESILYAISSEKYNLKGLLIDAYGTYSDPLTSEMIEKLRYNPNKLK